MLSHSKCLEHPVCYICSSVHKIIEDYGLPDAMLYGTLFLTESSCDEEGRPSFREWFICHCVEKG